MCPNNVSSFQSVSNYKHMHIVHIMAGIGELGVPGR